MDSETPVPDAPYIDYSHYWIAAGQDRFTGLTHGPCFSCKQPLRHFVTTLTITTHKMSICCICGYCGHINTLAEASMTTMTREPLCQPDTTHST